MAAAAPNPLYAHFAELLDYPTPRLARQARACAELLAAAYPQAAQRVREFRKYAQSTPPGRLEEIYTGTFDLNPACYVFCGYLLFGESFDRGKFLVRLQELYAERGFSTGSELADHIAVMFRFLALLDGDEETAKQLLEYCLVPALTTMSDSFKDEADSHNPYAQVLRAIREVLEAELGRLARPLAATVTTPDPRGAGLPPE